MESVAARKFLAIPELVERIFTFLDLKSTLSLARVLDKKILKSSMTSKMWTKLIRVNCPDVRILGLLGDAKKNALFAMKNLAALLKLIDGQGELLLDMLLGLISERFPAGPGQGQIELGLGNLGTWEQPSTGSIPSKTDSGQSLIFCMWAPGYLSSRRQWPQ